MKVQTTIVGVALGIVVALTACSSSGGQGAVISGTVTSGGGAAASGVGAGSGQGSATGGLPGSGTGDGTGADATIVAGAATSTPGDATSAAQMPILITADPAAAKFSQGVMSATAGVPLAVKFNNPSPNQHNWVLVQPGQEDAVAKAAASANGDLTSIQGVIAWSKPIANGTVTIDVPPLQQGGYVYMSTMPGDYPQMKGALNVR